MTGAEDVGNGLNCNSRRAAVRRLTWALSSRWNLVCSMGTEVGTMNTDASAPVAAVEGAGMRNTTCTKR